MNKKRVSIPKSVSEGVMKEYHHKCAMCGRHDPHLHHIDENPSNNEASNLLPLCPNCHLQDTHDPTTPHDPGKLRLFRRCKDPFILDPRFHPIWIRLQFLRQLNESDGNTWSYCCQDLVNFVRFLQLGEYYWATIGSVLRDPASNKAISLRRKGASITYGDFAAMQSAIVELRDFRATVIEDLCVEMLRYQGWLRPRAGTE